jgi:hypothetical protein
MIGTVLAPPSRNARMNHLSTIDRFGGQVGDDRHVGIARELSAGQVGSAPRRA